MVCVLVLGAGAPWESRALAELTEAGGVVVLKRCVDVDDLLATAATGQADVAVVALEAPGLDAPAVEHLRRHGVRPVAVVADPDREDASARLARLGVRVHVGTDALEGLPAAVTSVEDVADTRARPVPHGLDPATEDGGAVAAGMLAGPGAPGASAAASGDHGPADEHRPTGAHRVVAVWGPAGAPGRTTVATGLAAELARRGAATLLVDADPHAASVAQHLGVLDQVSGILSAARLASAGSLRERLPSACRSVGPHLDVMTGLPRSDRWAEVRPGAVGDVLETARQHRDVVVDTGFDLSTELGTGGATTGRNAMTLEVLDSADEVLVVGSADPVGLSRLARGLVELREVADGVPVRVAVNRMRPSLGWSPAEVAGMVEGFARVAGLHFLPDDRAGVDRALVRGCALGEAGESALSRAIGELADALFPTTYVAASRPGPVRRTVRRLIGGARRNAQAANSR